MVVNCFIVFGLIELKLGQDLMVYDLFMVALNIFQEWLVYMMNPDEIVDLILFNLFVSELTDWIDRVILNEFVFIFDILFDCLRD